MKPSTLAAERLRIDFYRERIQSLEEALRPLAELSIVFTRGAHVMPKPMDVLRARSLFGIDTPAPTALRAGLCRFGH